MPPGLLLQSSQPGLAIGTYSQQSPVAPGDTYLPITRAPGLAWAPHTHYPLDELVTNGGNTYLSASDHTSGSTFNASFWLQIGGGSGSTSTAATRSASATVPANETTWVGTGGAGITLTLPTAPPNATTNRITNASGANISLSSPEGFSNYGSSLDPITIPTGTTFVVCYITVNGLWFVVNATGVVPGAATSQSLGYKSLRSDFGLNPGMAVGTLTTAIQAAINTCIAAGVGLDIGADMWPINAALTFSGNLKIRGAGASELWGTVTLDNKTEGPGVAPWVQGGGFNQQTAATNVLNLTTAGVRVDLESVVLRFADAIAFANTGHGIYGVSSTNVAGAPDNGPTGCKWDNVIVFGHDGNHYAFYTTNMNLGTIIHPRSYGGGGWYADCLSTQSGYGNTVMIHPYFFVFVGGTADGFHFESSNAGAAYPGTLNLYTFIRPQCNLGAMASSQAIKMAYTFTDATAAQYIWKDVAVNGNYPQDAMVLMPDLEGTTAFIGPKTQIVGFSGDPRKASRNTVWGLAAFPNPVNPALDSTAIGYQALALNTAGAQNTAVGSQALSSNVSSSSMVAVGYQALKLATGGSSVAIGSQALASFTTVAGSFSNVAVGTTALSGTTTGARNTAIGTNAMEFNVTGVDNVAIGDGAGLHVTSNSNVAIGSAALSAASNTTTQTVAIGYQALLANTTGIANTAIGYQTLKANTTTSYNTAIGTQALLLATGQQNTAIGVGAGQTITTQSFTTAIGVNTAPTANGAVAIGVDHAGTSAATAVQDNIALGTALHTVQIANNATGAGSALLGANSPAGTLTAPYTWFKMLSGDGSTVYVPAWK